MLALYSEPFGLNDPREPYEFRIYGNDQATIWAVVDEEDYHWAIRWLWKPVTSRNTPKVYLVRSTRIKGRPVSIYLHVAIMERTGIYRPSASHVVVDHRNGNSLDCRRSNLRFATRSMNRINVHGSHPRDLVEG